MHHKVSRLDKVPQTAGTATEGADYLRSRLVKSSWCKVACKEGTQLCIMLTLQTQGSAEYLGLLLEEICGITVVKSIVDALTGLPLLLVADKYDVKEILSHCTCLCVVNLASQLVHDVAHCCL